MTASERRHDDASMRSDAQRDELVAWWLDQREDIRPEDVCEVRGDVLAVLLDRWTRTQPDREPARKRNGNPEAPAERRAVAERRTMARTPRDTWTRAFDALAFGDPSCLDTRDVKALAAFYVDAVQNGDAVLPEGVTLADWHRFVGFVEAK